MVMEMLRILWNRHACGTWLRMWWNVRQVLAANDIGTCCTVRCARRRSVLWISRHEMGVRMDR